MSTEEKHRLQAIVKGRVQGVSFRYYTARLANDLGLCGWVRNRLDGSVEVEAEGGQSALQQLLDFLDQGPPSARVDSVDAHWLPFVGELPEFTITS